MATQSMVIFKNSDDQLFEVSETVAIQSEHIKNMVKAHNPVDENSAVTTDEIKAWDEEFVKVDQATLFQLIQVFCLKPSFNWKFYGYEVFQYSIS